MWPLQVPTLGRRWERQTEGRGRSEKTRGQMKGAGRRSGFHLRVASPCTFKTPQSKRLRAGAESQQCFWDRKQKVGVGLPRKRAQGKTQLHEGGPSHTAATWPQRGGPRAIGKPNSRAGRCDSGLGHRCHLMAGQLWSRVSCRNSRWEPQGELRSGGSPPAWTSDSYPGPTLSPKGVGREPPASDRRNKAR